MIKFIAKITTLLAAVIMVASCSDEDIKGSITLSQRTAYVTEPGQSTVITFTTTDIVSMSKSSVPVGWGVEINMGAGTITITAPSDISDDSDNVKYGTVVIYGTSKSDSNTSASIAVGIAEQADISAEQANSYIVSEPNTIYTFNANYIAESSTAISPASVGIVWQSYPAPIAYAKLNGSKVEFYTNMDLSDKDSDGNKEDLLNGNALVAAYNSAGAILWSWHIWITPEVESVEFNSQTFMDRNLGAFANDNSSESMILKSYGLYYQWGRKEPFIYPNSYNASGSTNATMINNAGTSTTLTYEGSSATSGTLAYALQNPLTYIYGVEQTAYDWLQSHNNELWNSTSKSNYDPCPKGWRVPSAEAFKNLTIATPYQNEADLAQLKNKYGWELSDGTSTELFMGLGRRNQLNGSIQNINSNIENPAPWIGCYWSAESGANNLSELMYFELDGADSNINSAATMARANGLQIRCVKVE